MYSRNRCVEEDFIIKELMIKTVWDLMEELGSYPYNMGLVITSSHKNGWEGKVINNIYSNIEDDTIHLDIWDNLE